MTQDSDARAPLADGIYFDLPFADYLADQALGSHDMILLSKTPAEWQWQRLFPEDRDSPSLRWGRAFHTIVLDGREAFRQRHPVLPSQSDHPHALDTSEQIKTRLKELGLKVSAPRKEDLIERLREHDPGTVFWADVVRQFADALPPGAEPITAALHDEVVLASQMVTQNPHLSQAFVDGAPEVSVFWTRDGVRRKARIDYLKRRATVDLKSFRTHGIRNLSIAASRQVGAYRYDIQAAHYREARGQMEGLFEIAAVHGECPCGRDWLSEVAATRDWSWVWVFFKTEGAPLARGFECAPDVLDRAAQSLDQAAANWRAGMERFGPEAIWVDDTPIERFGVDDLPRFLDYD